MMFASLVGPIGVAWKFLAGFALFASLTDPAWAGPVNTLLLIVLGAIAAQNGRKLVRTEAKVDEAATNSTAAAQAAASAATAAADAARITREIGGTYRSTDGTVVGTLTASSTPTPGQTVPEGGR